MKDCEKFRNISERVIWKFSSTLPPPKFLYFHHISTFIFALLLQRGIDHCLIPEFAKELVSSSSSAAERKLVLLYEFV